MGDDLSLVFRCPRSFVRSANPASFPYVSRSQFCVPIGATLLPAARAGTLVRSHSREPKSETHFGGQPCLVST